MIVGIHQPQYLPWLGIIDRIIKSDIFVMLDNVPYSKNYFYNRNRIKTANGWNWITAPVLFKGKFGSQDYSHPFSLVIRYLYTLLDRIYQLLIV